MNNLFSPLFTRIRQKYTPFPVSCGITVDTMQEKACFVRAREKLLLFSTAETKEELFSCVSQPHLPDVICVAAPPGKRDSWILTSVMRCAREEGIPVIFTETAAVKKVLGATDCDAEGISTTLREAGFLLRPTVHTCVLTALIALTGYFFLNKEYEVRNKNIVPLLLEIHPLFSFLRRIPYGEVATYPDVAKELGLQWNEAEVMQELCRLPYGADVPGHRIVGRNGQLSELFPGGLTAQKERLKWELVPFSEPTCVQFPQARWSRHKYKRLTNYLTHVAPESRFLELQFTELESIIEGTLPKAARRLGSWWRDEKPYAVIWRDAGWSIADVNMQLATVTFARINLK